jgi:hypothetical protein
MPPAMPVCPGRSATYGRPDARGKITRLGDNPSRAARLFHEPPRHCGLEDDGHTRQPPQLSTKLDAKLCKPKNLIRDYLVVTPPETGREKFAPQPLIAWGHDRRKPTIQLAQDECADVSDLHDLSLPATASIIARIRGMCGSFPASDAPARMRRSRASRCSGGTVRRPAIVSSVG